VIACDRAGGARFRVRVETERDHHHPPLPEASNSAKRRPRRVTTKTKRAIAIGGGIAVLAAGAAVLLSKRGVDIPGVSSIVGGGDPVTCPLSGEEPSKESLVDRPAVAVKIENSQVAYPLSGLEDAEVVFEELVEGGVTRFMAVYHCTDSEKAGPVRSARAVDPAIMTPITRILAYSGQNGPVLKALEAAEIVRLNEDEADGGLQRIPREGYSSEHTLYADTKILRKIGQKEYSDPPSDDIFEFGDINDGAKKAVSITINFNPSNTIRYEWSSDRWLRFEGDTEFVMESGDQLAVDNVLIEEHQVDLSDTIVDVNGTPSTEIADPTGSGRAVLFRDGKAIVGTWSRESLESSVVFKTKSGDTMQLTPGNVWIELVPSDKGEVKGSFDFARK
jgi:hypothetical protein